MPEPAAYSQEEKEELLRFATRGKMPGEAEIQRILAFPDLEPLLTLLDNRNRWKEFYLWLPGAATRRGMDMLLKRPKGALPWNVLLDKVSVKSTIARSGFNRPTHNENEIDRWLGKASEKEILAMLEFSSPEILMRVGKNAVNVTDKFVSTLLEKHPEFAFSLARNENLLPHHREMIDAWVLENMDKAIEVAEDEPKEGVKILLRVTSTVYSMKNKRDEKEVSPSIIERALLHLHGNFPEENREWEHIHSHLVSILSASPQHIPPQEADFAAPLLAPNVWTVRGILERKDLSIELLRALARQPRLVKIRELLALHPQAMADPEIVQLLSKSNNAKVAKEIIKQAEGDLFRKSFKRLAGKDPNAAMGALEERIEEVGESIEPTDLLPVLKHKDAEARERAMRNVHKVGSRSKRGGR